MFLLGGWPRNADPTFIDPTGTYILKGEVRKNKITGHSGEVRAKLLDQHTVALCMYMNDGYPDYASGAMTDTLSYEDNKSYYHPTHDSTCFIVFMFGYHTVELMQVFSDPHSGCGFAPGVMTPAVFEKSSSDVPVIQDLSGHGLVAGRLQFRFPLVAEDDIAKTEIPKLIAHVGIVGMVGIGETPVPTGGDLQFLVLKSGQDIHPDIY
jgi:hypothetical protein